MLQEFVDSLPTFNGTDKKLAKHSVEIIITVLGGAFKKAVYPWKLIRENPMQYVEPPV